MLEVVTMSALKKSIILAVLALNFIFLPNPAKAAPLDATNFNMFIHGQTTFEGSIGHTMFCGLIGFSPLNDCMGYQFGQSGGVNPIVLNRLPSGGALGTMGATMAMMYSTPPSSVPYYLAYVGENIGVVPQTVYAQGVQGTGQSVLQPIFQIWQAVRNLSYLFFIIVFIVVGVMIMLRQRINPQTVVTAQQALPGLVIGLVLVTFSYFIAALITDLAFWGVQAVAQLFIFAQNGASPPLINAIGNDGDITNLAQDGNVFQLFSSAGFNLSNIGTIWTGVQGQIGQSFGGNLASFVPGVIAAIGGTLILGPWAGLAGGLLGSAIGPVIIPTIVVLVLLIALVIQMFRLLFSLLSSYIQILIFTLAGPLFILFGSIPGRGNVIALWWRGLLGNVLVFPAVFGVFLFAGLIMGDNQSMWSGGVAMPLFGGTDINFIKAIIAYGILLGSPTVPDTIRRAFGAQGPGGLAAAALAGLGVGVGLGRTAGTAGWNTALGPTYQVRNAYREARARALVTGGVPPAAPPANYNTGLRGVITRTGAP